MRLTLTPRCDVGNEYVNRMRSHGRRTGPKPGFTHDDVVTAALEIGIRDFTLAGVAKRLGVGTPALYRTIASRDDLLRGCLKRLAEENKFTVPECGWRELLRHQAEWLWGLVDRHPGLAETFLVVTWAHHYFVRGMKTCIDALVERGFSPDDAVFAVDFIGDTVLCTHLVIEANRAILPGEDGTVATGLEVAVENFNREKFAEDFPEQLVPNEGWTGRGFLDRKIEFVIEGMARRVGG